MREVGRTKRTESHGRPAGFAWPLSKVSRRILYQPGHRHQKLISHRVSRLILNVFRPWGLLLINLIFLPDASLLGTFNKLYNKFLVQNLPFQGSRWNQVSVPMGCLGVRAICPQPVVWQKLTFPPMGLLPV